MFGKSVSVLAIACLLIVSVAGCGGTSQTAESQEESLQNQEVGEELREESRRLLHRYEEAQAEGLAFFAPRHLEEAKRLVKSLDELPRDEEGLEKAQNRFTQLEQVLEEARAIRERAENFLGPTLDRWKLATRLGGTQHSDAYQEARTALTDVLHKVEQGHTPDGARAEAEHKITELQVKTLRGQLMDPVGRKLDHLRSENLHEIAPQSFRRAQESYREAISKLEDSPYDLIAAQRNAARADSLAQVASRVAERVERLRGMNAAELENEVLAEYRHLAEAERLSGVPNRADLPLGEALAQHAREVSKVNRRQVLRRPSTTGRIKKPDTAEAGQPQRILSAPSRSRLRLADQSASAQTQSAPPVPSALWPTTDEDFRQDPPPPVRIDREIDPGRGMSLGESEFPVGTLQIGGRPATSMALGVVMLEAESQEELTQFAGRWEAEVESGPSNSESGEYVLTFPPEAGPTAVEVQGLIRETTRLSSRVQYTFSSMEALSTFGAALAAQQNGRNVRLLWLDTPESPNDD